MSMLSSLYTGVSGLSSHGNALSVVGDNLANTNTVGFKKSRANFEDILASSIGTRSEVGLGSRLAQVQKMFLQGSLLGTGRVTDLAIQGDGFFVVKGNFGSLNGQFYTRAGQFTVANDGTLVNDNGLAVQGYNVDSSNNLITSVSDVVIPSMQLPPIATTNVEIDGNLDANATPPTTPWDINDPGGTSNFSNSVVVYDSLGGAHTVNVYFEKDTGAGAWKWHALVDGGEITGGIAGTWEEEASGTLTFDTQGRLTSSNTTGDFDFVGAEQNQSITFDFGDPTPPGTGLMGLTSYKDSSTTTYIDQNGSSSASLSGISIEKDGIINGVFSNGEKRTVGQILLADFGSPEGLQRIGGNLYTATVLSGQANIGEASTGGRGTINSGSLEQSNVDVAQEFVDMIAFQRGFQANSRTISTADMLLQEVINLVR